MFISYHRTSNYESSCTHEASNYHFIEGQIKQRIVPYATGIRNYLKSVLTYTFLILHTYHPDTLYFGNDVRIRGYFPKPHGVREQKRLVNTAP
jgi:hypothetical protein